MRFAAVCCALVIALWPAAAFAKADLSYVPTAAAIAGAGIAGTYRTTDAAITAGLGLPLSFWRGGPEAAGAARRRALARDAARPRRAI